jgi:molecular chaperone HtpG
VSEAPRSEALPALVEPPTSQAFQVDLRGVVDLLARHLYSGPRVYLRELLQNAVDAITARRELEPGFQGKVRLRCGDDATLEVLDTGIGLTIDEAGELLATIGSSSKRDLALGTARSDFLGQFGIGLLSAFMVADEIEMVTRSARPGARPVRWQGFSDGSYQLTEMPDDDTPVGARVRIKGRRDTEHWVARETVVALATDFGSLLPVDIAIEMPVGSSTTWRRVTEPELPWLREYADAGERTAALTRYCETALGFTPLAHLDLEVPLAGVTGVAFVLPSAASPTSAGAHRVYVKRMLLGARVEGVLPEWAFFVRCVLDSSDLRPTASREQLYDDDVLLGTREALGRAVHEWLKDILSRPVGLRRKFLDAHHLAVRALALTDDTMLATAATVLPFETTDGVTTLQDVADTFGQVLYTPNLEEYRRVAPVARAQRLTVVNAGYVYDADLLARLARRRPEWKVRALSTDDVRQVLAPVDPAMELVWLDALAGCTRTLAGHDVEVVVRTFEPEGLPAVLLHDRVGDHQRDLARIAKTKDVWGVSLSSLARPATARQLVLNAANPIVTRLLSAPPGPVRDAGIQSVYVSALLLSGEPLRSRETDLMTRSLSVLLESGLPASDPTGTGAPTKEDQS